MIHNDSEFDKRGVCQLLLTCGATPPSKSPRIFPQPVVHVIDTSLVVGACNSLLSEILREPFLAEHQACAVKELKLVDNKGFSTAFIP